MGDYPSKQAHSSVEVTDQIFVAAIQEEVLRDEIYCQIMKQLTENRNRYSPKFKQPASIGPRVLKCRWWSGNSATPVVGWGQTEGYANGLLPSLGLTFSEHSEPLTGTARPWSGTIIHLPSAAPISIHCSSLCTMARKVLLKPFFCPNAACGENMILQRVLGCFQWLFCQPSICFKLPNDSISLLQACSSH